MTVIITAMTHLYALLTTTWPTAGGEAILLHPDDKETSFEAALEEAEADEKVVVRYWHPQLLESGAMGRYLCQVDVCSRSAEDAATRADELLAVLDGSNARVPTGAIRPAAVSIREASYQRVVVTFTLLSESVPA